MSNHHPPYFEAYHRSITEELHSLKNRIRDLARHWPTDGEHKEVALRSVLRRHLPETCHVGRGFVVTPNRTSQQIDVLVIDANAPTLFRDGDLFIVTPGAVKAIIEVKTRVRGDAAIRAALQPLAQNASLCHEHWLRPQLWTGLFVYEGGADHESLLIQLAHTKRQTGYAVDCIASGRRTFVRHWERLGGCWRSYELENLAPSYFIGNLLLSLGGSEMSEADFAWFPIQNGKEPYRRFEIGPDDTAPRACAAELQ